MIQGTPREANSLSPVPSAARPSRTARHMLLSFMDRGLPLAVDWLKCASGWFGNAPPSPQPRSWFQGLALGGSPEGQRPLVGSRGEALGLACFARLPWAGQAREWAKNTLLAICQVSPCFSRTKKSV